MLLVNGQIKQRLVSAIYVPRASYNLKQVIGCNGPFQQTEQLETAGDGVCMHLACIRCAHDITRYERFV